MCNSGQEESCEKELKCIGEVADEQGRVQRSRLTGDTASHQPWVCFVSVSLCGFVSQVCLVVVCNFAERVRKYFPEEVLAKSTETIVLSVGHRVFLTPTWSLTH